MAENGGAAKSSLAAATAGNHVNNAEVNGGSDNSTAANVVRFTVQVATLSNRLDRGYA